MKTLAFCCIVSFALFLPQCVLAQKDTENMLKNGGFERFTGDNPDNWDANNIPGTLTVVSASKVSNWGMRAVKIEVKDFFGSVVAGYICQKNIETGGKNLRLDGHFALQAVGKDQGLVVFSFQNPGGSTLGSEEIYLDDTKGKFVPFMKDIKAPAGAALVQMRVTILPEKGGEKAHPGSSLLCDDFKLALVAVIEKPLIQ